MIALALVALALSQSAPVTVAAPGWKTVQVPPELASFFADHLAQSLRGQGLKVITQTEIAAMIGNERQAQLLGCDEASRSCTGELANALGAKLTLIGSIAKLDESLEVHLELIESVNGAVVSETRVSAVGQTAMLKALDEAAERLVEGLRPPRPRAGVRRWAWVPGLAGVLALGAGIGLDVAAGDQYHLLERSLHAPLDATSDTSVRLARNGSALQTGGWVAIGVGSAALVAAGLLFLFGAAPDSTPTAWLEPGGLVLGWAARFP